jgi:phage-related minor tail protein
MPKNSFSVSITSEGLDQLRRDLEAIGPQAKASFDRLAAATPQLSKALDDLGKSAKLSYTNVEILRSGVINTFQSLVAGMDPIQVLTTQLAQTAPAFGELAAKAGLSRAALLGIGGVATAAIAAVTAVGFAYEKGAAQTAAFNEALRISANAAGMTAGRMDEIAKSAIAFGKVGPGAARAIATELTATGKLSADVIAKLTSMSGDYAAATKTDAETAGKALGQIFSDPLKGMKQLDDAYNLLSAAERRHIQDLVAQGDQTQAQIVLADSLNERINHLATDGMGLLGKTIYALGKAWDHYYDAALGIGRTKSIEEQIADNEAAIAKALAARENTGSVYAGADLPALLKKRTELTAEKKGQDLDRDLAQQAADLQDLGKQADSAAGKFATFADKQRDLRNEIIKWDAARQKFHQAALTGENDTTIQQYQQAEKQAIAARDGAQRALNALKSPLDQAQQALMDQQRISAAPPYQRAALQAGISAKNAALADPQRAADADKLAAIATAQAIEQQSAALRDRNTQLNTGITLTGAATDAWLKSESAGQAADAQREAVLQSLNDGMDVTTRKAQILQQQAADAAESGAKQVRQLDQQVAAQQKVVDAAAKGRQAEAQALLDNQIAEKTKDLQLALQKTTDPDRIRQLNIEIQATGKSMTELAQGAREIDLDHVINQQKDQINLLQVQMGLVHAGNDERSIAIAHAQALLYLEQQMIDPLSKQGQQYLQNADSMARMTLELQRQQAIAQELPNFFDQAFDRIGSAITQFAVQGGNALSDVRNIGNAMLSEFIQEGIKLSLINPFKNWAMGSTSLPTFGDVVGGGSGSSGTSSSGNSTISSAAAGITRGDMFSGGSASSLLGSLVPKGSILGNWMSNSNSLAGAGNATTADYAVANQTSVFSNLNWGGAGIAAGLAALPQLLNGNIAGGLLSGGLAGIGTLVGGPIGGLVGGLLGNVFGGLFNKPKWIKSQASAYMMTGDYGGLTLDHYKTKRASLSDAQAIGSGLSDAFGGLTDELGVTFDPGQLVYMTSITKSKGKKKKSWFESNFGGTNFGKFATSDEAMAALLSGALGIGATQGTIQGLAPGMGEVFKSAYAKNGVVTSQDDLTKLTDFAKFYAQIDTIRTPTDAAAKALRDLAIEMNKQQRAAELYGVSVEKVTQIFTDNFNQGIQDQILQLKDAQAYALKQLDLDHAAEVAQAQKLGGDLAAVEELYGLKRQQILESGLNSMNDSLQSFFNQLTLGDLSALSPTDQLSQATKQYQAVVASGNKAGFQDAATNYLNILRGFYGSGTQYAAGFQDVLGQLKGFGIPGFATGGDFGGGIAMVGERGAELMATGPARFFDAATTQQILAGRAANSNASPRQMLDQIADPGMRSLLGALHDRINDLGIGMRELRNAYDRNSDIYRFGRK